MKECPTVWHWEYGAWWMGLAMILFWVGVAVIVWIVRSSTSRGEPPRGSRALDALDERYARGEIDDDEYQRRREMLRRS